MKSSDRYARPSNPGFSKKSVKTCWEHMRCSMSQCAAHEDWRVPCWRLSHTCCEAHYPAYGRNKVDACLTCTVFKLNAEADPLGWGHFVASEMAYLTHEVIQPNPAALEEIYLQTLEHLPYGLMVTDNHDRVCYANTAAERMMGIAGEAIETRTIRELFGNRASPLSCIRWGLDGEFDLSRPDGSVVPVHCTTTILQDGCGAQVGTMYVLEDITDRLHLEDDLKCSEDNYRRLFEGTKDMIFIHSKGGILKDVNQACVELLGYKSKEELLSLASVERVYVNPMHRKVFQEQVDRYGFVKDFDTTFKKKDGSRIHCIVSGTAVRDKEGRHIGYEAVSKDITARMDGVRNLHHQHRELALLHSVAVSMNVAYELEEILLVALKKVLEVLNLNTGAIFLINHEKSDFILKAQQGLEGLAQQGFRILIHDEALMESMFKTERSLKPQRTFPPFKATLEGRNDGEAVQLLCFLITAKGVASGFIALEVPPNKSIIDRDHQMLGSLGNFLGGAIENATLWHANHKHREELKGLTARLFHSQEEERKKIAQELHDEVGQALAGINLTLETILKDLSPKLAHTRENILDIRKQINRTYQEMRRLSHSLHPALLNDLGLEPALEYCLGRVSKHSGIGIDLKMVGFEGRLDPEIETILYRISQEAITNTLKHSGAKHFKLSIIKGFPKIIFLAEDDGKGFDLHSGAPGGVGLGLLSMRERAAMVGGTFCIRTAAGKGTRIRIEIPIKESVSDE